MKAQIGPRNNSGKVFTSPYGLVSGWAYPNGHYPQHIASVYVHGEGVWFALMVTNKTFSPLKAQSFSSSGQREAKISPVVSKPFDNVPYQEDIWTR